jgi:hypothetical protein
MSTSSVQVWVGIIGTLATIVVSILGVLHFQGRRDKAASVGSAFRNITDDLASDNATRRMAAAVVIRRFFDVRSEQGLGRTPYAKEALSVIAGLLRSEEAGHVQKALADSLRDAPSLKGADLQGCNLTEAYLGRKDADDKRADLTGADLFGADLTRASLKGIVAQGTAFRNAVLSRTVLTGADLRGANFSWAKLDGAKFDGARVEGALFEGAIDIPPDIASRLDSNQRVPSGSTILP